MNMREKRQVMNLPEILGCMDLRFLGSGVREASSVVLESRRSVLEELYVRITKTNRKYLKFGGNE